MRHAFPGTAQPINTVGVELLEPSRATKAMSRGSWRDATDFDPREIDEYVHDHPADGRGVGVRIHDDWEG